MELTAILTPANEGDYIAFNPETGTTTQGESIEEALANLREATKLYLEEFPITITKMTKIFNKQYKKLCK
jgi:predicted RNase H-like HicB family nuclease